MRTRNRNTRNRNTRNRKTKGGVLFFQTEVQDIMPELQRFLSGKSEVVGDGRHGVILRFTSDESTVLRSEKCGLKHILVKVVAIDKNATIQRYSIEKTSVLQFEDEVHIHQDICEASVKKFNCSIAPTLLYAQIYTLTELADQFPALKLTINTAGRIGLIFMEMIKADKDDYPAFNLYDYYRMPINKPFVLSLFPKARRLLIMLAQLGFLHNDFHLRNFVCQENPLVLYIIDFGRATRMTEKQKIEFNGYVEADNVEKMVTFLYGTIKQYIYNNTGFLYYQWLNQHQIDTVVSGIDPSIEFASQESIVAPIRFAEDQHALCVFPPKIPYGEIDRPERERIMREEKEEADRIRKKMEERFEELRKITEKRLADEKAAYEEKLAKETPEEKALREEKEAAEKVKREEQEAEKLRRLDPNYFPY